MIFFRTVVFLLFMIFFASCNNAVCDISDVQATVVFDFKSESEKAECRTCVFVQTQANAWRTAEITVFDLSSDYFWRVENPVLLSSKAGDWAGCTNLLGENGEALSCGDYRIFYKNASGEEAEEDFSISYPKEFLELSASDFPKALESGSFSKKIAVYDENGSLIFFAPLENESKTAVSEKFVDGAFMRVCYVDNLKKYACFMPPVSLSKN